VATETSIEYLVEDFLKRSVGEKENKLFGGNDNRGKWRSSATNFSSFISGLNDVETTTEIMDAESLSILFCPTTASEICFRAETEEFVDGFIYRHHDVELEFFIV